jgi:hypothetical protein
MASVGAPPRPAASAVLRHKIELADRPFGVACTAVMRHPRIAEVWPEYLIKQYGIIRTTVPLMQTAAGCALALADGDPVAAGTAEYLTQHIDEERGHDEWMLGDLEVLGYSRSTVLERNRLPSAAVARLIGAQYYWALYCHPVAVLGYFAFMERYPPTSELIEDLIARTGYPREAFHTFAEHAEIDPRHRDELDAVIDSLPLSPEHESLLGLSAIATAELLAETLDEVLASVGPG